MKSLITILAAGALAASSFTASAQLQGRGGPHPALEKQADFESLAKGSQLVLVCKVSDTVQVVDVKDAKHGRQLAKEGHKTHCAACRKSYKVTYAGNPSGKAGTTATSRLTIVDANGEPCMFYARLK